MLNVQGSDSGQEEGTKEDVRSGEYLELFIKSIDKCYSRPRNKRGQLTFVLFRWRIIKSTTMTGRSCFLLQEGVLNIQFE